MLFCLLLLVCTGCTTPPKQEVLANYVNRDMLGIARVEQAALQRYARATGENFTSVEALFVVLDREVIPTYKRFYELLRQIRPDDQEVAQAHSLYVRGAKDVLKGFEVKKYGLETRDVDLILMGNEKIDKGLRQTQEWKTKIDVLRKARGLKTTEEMDSIFARSMIYINEKLLEMGQSR
jgi:hypothetical protein